MPKVQRSSLTLLRKCIRQDSWKQCKAGVLKKFFTWFVGRCSMFSFQQRHCRLRDFIKEVVDAADSSNTEPREILYSI
jgi:hypothetical protein